MNLEFLSEENIRHSLSLFDLVLLVWWELQINQGTIRVAIETAQDSPDLGQTAARLVDDAICETWARSPELAGNKEIDDQVRDAMIIALREYPPESSLLQLLLLLERRCSDIKLRRHRPLNSRFQQLGSIYLNRSPKLRDNMAGTPEPPLPVADWPPARLSGLSVLPNRPSDIQVEFVDVPFSYAGVAPGQELTFGIGDQCNDSDHLHLTQVGHGGGRAQYRVDLRAAESIEDRLRAVIHELNVLGAHIGVLPELSSSPSVLAAASEALQSHFDATRGNGSLRLLVAGTYHHDLSGDRVENICHVLGPDGTVLWTQCKLNPFVWETEGHESQEALDVSKRSLRICDLWFARTAVTVCLDFLADDVRDAVEYLGVTCLLVPSLTASTLEFQEVAYQNARALSAGAVLSNAWCQVATPDPDLAASFSCFPSRGTKEKIIRTDSLSPGPRVRTFSVLDC